MNRQETLNRIREAGVVGAGGAGFPTWRKLDTQVEHIIANGAECEPLLSKDRECMLQQSQDFIEGLRIMQQITGAQTVTIVVKQKNADVVDALKSLAEPHGFKFLVYADVYPAGDEYVLVYAVTGRRIPPGGLPFQVGCVVDNVETIIHVAQAIAGRPVTEKYVTVTGAVKNPQTFKVPVGTPMSWCIDKAGGATVDNPTLLTGGVMMGGVTTRLDDPITKTIGGIIVLPSDHYLVQRKTAPKKQYTQIGHGQCDQCSMCTQLCPRYLLGYPIEPHKVMRTLLMTGDAKARGSLWAQFCCECNICSMVACPENLDPKSICVDAKQLLRENKLSRSEKEIEQLFAPVHPARHGREMPIKTLYTRLGLTPYDRKAPWTEPARDTLTQVVIPLNNHIGVPCKPAVQVGDRVQPGQTIGTLLPEQMGCYAHCSVNGTVTAIENHCVTIAVQTA